MFPRSFDGLLGEKHYFEALQEFVHVLGLHHVPERRAYCRLDKRGDVEDMIRIVHVDRSAGDLGGMVILFKREILDEWMTLTDSAVVQTFDFTRVRLSSFGGWSNTAAPKRTVDGDLMFRSVLEPGRASYARGVQIVRSGMKKEALFDRIGWSPTKEEDDRQYASFIAHDFKNEIVREISTAPGETANYFTKSDLPFETSPAFSGQRFFRDINRTVTSSSSKIVRLPAVARGIFRHTTSTRKGRSILTSFTFEVCPTKNSSVGRRTTKSQKARSPSGHSRQTSRANGISTTTRFRASERCFTNGTGAACPGGRFGTRSSSTKFTTRPPSPPTNGARS